MPPGVCLQEVIEIQCQQLQLSQQQNLTCRNLPGTQVHFRTAMATGCRVLGPHCQADERTDKKEEVLIKVNNRCALAFRKVFKMLLLSQKDINEERNSASLEVLFPHTITL